MTTISYIGFAIGAYCILFGILEIVKRKCYYQNVSRYPKKKLEQFSRVDGTVEIAIGIAIIFVMLSPMVGDWMAAVGIVLCGTGVFCHILLKRKILGAQTKKL